MEPQKINFLTAQARAMGNNFLFISVDIGETNILTKFGGDTPPETPQMDPKINF